MASNNDGIWNNEGVSLKIKVAASLWKTNIAFALFNLHSCSLFVTRKLIHKGSE